MKIIEGTKVRKVPDIDPSLVDDPYLKALCLSMNKFGLVITPSCRH